MRSATPTLRLIPLLLIMAACAGPGISADLGLGEHDADLHGPSILGWGDRPQGTGMTS